MAELGFFIPVLHAHVPYGAINSLEEKWLREYLTNVLYPLLRVLERLEDDEVGYGLTLAISPTLTLMLENEELMHRYSGDLQDKIIKAEADKSLNDTLHSFNLESLRDTLYWHEKRAKEKPLAAFQNIAALGNLELITSPATQGALPLLRTTEGAVELQVSAACEAFRKSIGINPAGFWLSECAYYSELEHTLLKHGIKYFFLAQEGFFRAESPLENGVHQPLWADKNIAAFGRNRELCKQIESDTNGYFLDGDYLDSRQNIESDSFVFNRQDGQAYSPEYAANKADLHANHYLSCLTECINNANCQAPVAVISFEAEVFGLKWREGAKFLDLLLRKMNYDQETIKATTPSKYLQKFPNLPLCRPGDSSWMTDWDFSEFFRDKREALLPEMNLAATRFFALTNGNKDILQAMKRELLMAQTADWLYQKRRGQDTDYGQEKQRRHLARFSALEKMLSSNSIDSDAVSVMSIEAAPL